MKFAGTKFSKFAKYLEILPKKVHKFRKSSHGFTQEMDEKKIKVRRWLDKGRKKRGHSYLGARIYIKNSKPIAKFFTTLLERENWIEQKTKVVSTGAGTTAVSSGKTTCDVIKLKWAISQYLQHGESIGWRPLTIKARVERLGKMLTTLGNVPLGELERPDVIRFIETGKSNYARQGYSADAVAFLNWCGNVDQGRDWVPPYKFSKLQWARFFEDEKEIGILTPDETALLLRKMPEDLTASTVLAFFAGIRPKGEMSRLDWRDIDFGRRRIIVKGEVSKTRTRRVLSDMPDNLWAWLEAYRGSGVVLENYNRYQNCRARACKKLSIDFARDGARHSFASYGYWRGEEWCRRVMGHTQTSDIFHRHYVDAGPSRQESEEYFGIMP